MSYRIHGKDHRGNNTTVSIDYFLWPIVRASFKDDQEARGWIRDRMAQCKSDTTGTLSLMVRGWCYERIAKPSLFKRAYGDQVEQQVDIEDLT